MNDDWRVQVTCPTTSIAENLGAQLREGGFEHGMQESAGARVIVSVDGPELFLYAGAREQAEKAVEAVKTLANRANANISTNIINLPKIRSYPLFQVQYTIRKAERF